MKGGQHPTINVYLNFAHVCFIHCLIEEKKIMGLQYTSCEE